MFRKMRRSRQELSAEECLAILERGTCGVLAVSGLRSMVWALLDVLSAGVYFRASFSMEDLFAASSERMRSFPNGGTCGVLAVSGDEGYPYAVPISYVYDNEKIYFHSAVSSMCRG